MIAAAAKAAALLFRIPLVQLAVGAVVVVVVVVVGIVVAVVAVVVVGIALGFVAISVSVMYDLLAAGFAIATNSCKTVNLHSLIIDPLLLRHLCNLAAALSW